MKRMVLVIAILAAGIPVFAQTVGLREFDFFGGQGGNPRGIDFALDGKGLLVSGSHNDASGYMVIADEDLELSGKRRLIITISGITENDAFDMSKLLKLELNDEPQITVSPGMKNRNDHTYINARNGSAVFDLSGLQNIRKVQLVFWNCAVEALSIRVFYQ